MGKTKSARIDDEELLELLEAEGEKVKGGSSEVIRRALRKDLYEENFGLEQEDYGDLIEQTGEFVKCFYDDEKSADDLYEHGQNIYDMDEEIGDMMAKVVVYMEEQQKTDN
jgi:Arc/MetJ-type ribon-helix-helix transcriptional regulator